MRKQPQNQSKKKSQSTTAATRTAHRKTQPHNQPTAHEPMFLSLSRVSPPFFFLSHTAKKRHRHGCRRGYFFSFLAPLLSHPPRAFHHTHTHTQEKEREKGRETGSGHVLVSNSPITQSSLARATTTTAATNTMTNNDGYSDSNKDASTPPAMVGPFGITPAHVLFAAAVPFCGGAYFGFRKQIAEAKKDAAVAQAAAAAKNSDKMPSPEALRQSGRILGARALGIATLMSVGGFGMIGAGMCVCLCEDEASTDTLHCSCRHIQCCRCCLTSPSLVTWSDWGKYMFGQMRIASKGIYRLTWLEPHWSLRLMLPYWSALDSLFVLQWISIVGRSERIVASLGKEAW